MCTGRGIHTSGRTRCCSRRRGGGIHTPGHGRVPVSTGRPPPGRFCTQCHRLPIHDSNASGRVRRRVVPEARRVGHGWRIRGAGTVVLVDVNLRDAGPRAAVAGLGQGIQLHVAGSGGVPKVHRLAGGVVGPGAVERAECFGVGVGGEGDAPVADVAVAHAVLAGQVGETADVVDLAHVDGDAMGERVIGRVVLGVPIGVVIAVDGFVAVLVGGFPAVDVAVPLGVELVDAVADALTGAQVGGQVDEEDCEGCCCSLQEHDAGRSVSGETSRMRISGEFSTVETICKPRTARWDANNERLFEHRLLRATVKERKATASSANLELGHIIINIDSGSQSIRRWMPRCG